MKKNRHRFSKLLALLIGCTVFLTLVSSTVNAATKTSQVVSGQNSPISDAVVESGSSSSIDIAESESASPPDSGEEDAVPGIPINHLIIFVVGLLACTSGLIIMQIKKSGPKNRMHSTDEYDEYDE